jgi:hypothetical protein
MVMIKRLTRRFPYMENDALIETRVYFLGILIYIHKVEFGGSEKG